MLGISEACTGGGAGDRKSTVPLGRAVVAGAAPCVAVGLSAGRVAVALWMRSRGTDWMTIAVSRVPATTTLGCPAGAGAAVPAERPARSAVIVASVAWPVSAGADLAVPWVPPA